MSASLIDEPARSVATERYGSAREVIRPRTELGPRIDIPAIPLLQSILSVVQMPDAGRQVIYGAVILAMLLLYGRGSRVGGECQPGSRLSARPLESVRLTLKRCFSVSL